MHEAWKDVAAFTNAYSWSAAVFVAAAAAAAVAAAVRRRRSRRGALIPRSATRAVKATSDCTYEQLSTCVADPGCTDGICSGTTTGPGSDFEADKLKWCVDNCPQNNCPATNGATCTLSRLDGSPPPVPAQSRRRRRRRRRPRRRRRRPSLRRPPRRRPCAPPPPPPHTPPADPPPPPPHTPPGAVVREGWAQPRYPHKVKDKAYCGNRICFGSSCNTPQGLVSHKADSLAECAAAVNEDPNCGNGFSYGSDDKYCDCPPDVPDRVFDCEVYDGGAQELPSGYAIYGWYPKTAVIWRTRSNHRPASFFTAKAGSGPCSAAGVAWACTRAARWLTGSPSHRRRIRPTLTTTATRGYARSKTCAGKRRVPSLSS